MEKEVPCAKPNHNVPLDMICLDKSCSGYGIFCHKCFIGNTHHHMSSEIMSLNSFLAQSHKTLDEAYMEISSINEVPVASAREEFANCKKLLDSGKKRNLNIIRQLFEDIEEGLNSKFDALASDVEGPRTKVLAQLDKYKETLGHLKNGENSNQNDLSKEILSLWNLFQVSENNELTLKQDMLPRPKTGVDKEERLGLFRSENKTARKCIEKVNEWLKFKPSLDKQEPLSQSQAFNEEPKDKENVPQVIQAKPAANNSPPAQNNQVVPTTPLVIQNSPIPQVHTSSSIISSPITPVASIMKSSMRKLNPLDENDFLIKAPGSQPLKKVKTESEPRVEIQANPRSTPLKPNNLNRDTFPVHGIQSHTETPKKVERPNEALNRSFNGSGKSTVKKSLQCIRFSIDEGRFDRFKEMDTIALTFSTEKDLNLLGFGQYMINKPVSSAEFEYVVLKGDSSDVESSQVITSGKFTLLRSEDSQRVMPVMFSSAVKTQRGRFYTIKVTNVEPDSDLYCYKGTNGVEKRTPFIFYVSKSVDVKRMRSHVKKGQIPELFFTN